MLVLLEAVLLKLVRMKLVLPALFTIFKDSSRLDPIKLPSEDLGRVSSDVMLIAGAGAKLALGVTVMGLFVVLLLVELLELLDGKVLLPVVPLEDG